ncbi:MAG: CBS domain-containing protein [Actinomycetota bacterium]
MEKITVGEVMTKRVISVREETPFKELARLMMEHDVSGLPVLNSTGRLAGIVTEADLLEVVGEPTGVKKRHTQFGRLLDRLVSPGREGTVDRSTAYTSAKSLMTTDVITTTPATPAREAARHIVESGIKRLPVVDSSGHVVGIVSRQDLLRPYLQDDERIREEVLENLAKRVLWIDPSTIKVLVDKGVVSLHGFVAKQSQKEILIELTSRVDGVVSVADHMAAAENDRDFEPEWMRKESARAEPWTKVAQIYGYDSSDKR